MFYNPNVTWHDTWLSAVAGDKPFADVYKVDGLRGIYIASQIHDSWNSATHTGNGNFLRSISPNDLRSLITFDGGAIWTPIKGPKTDEEGRNFTNCENMRGYECKLHLSQKLSSKFPSTRSIPIMSSSSAIGVIIASGNMGKTLGVKNNVFVSADAGLSWHQILKGSHYFNMGDHGGTELFFVHIYHFIDISKRVRACMRKSDYTHLFKCAHKRVCPLACLFPTKR